jgi:hypothetical protein
MALLAWNMGVSTLKNKVFPLSGPVVATTSNIALPLVQL